MPAAVKTAEAGGFVHVRRGEHEVDAVGILGQCAAGDGGADHGFDGVVAQPLALGVIVGGGAGDRKGAGDVLRIVAVGGVDQLVSGAAHAAGAEELGANQVHGCLAVGSV